jgi:hypothetical protein
VSVLALVAPPGTSERGVPLLALLGRGVDVRSWARIERTGGEAPDALLVTTVDALAGLPAVPTAVWVADEEELRRAVDAGVAVALSSQAELVRTGALFVPRNGIDVLRWPPIAPLVRQRWRERYGLPPELVVGVDAPRDPEKLAGPLALASVAVLAGPSTALALALGTPLVTNPSSARRLGLRPGVDAEVAPTGDRAAAVARAIAADQDRAAVLSRRGRRFAECHLDLSRPAAVVRRRLGIDPTPLPSGVDLAIARLDELGTPPVGPIRHRLAVAVETLISGGQP